MDRGAAVLKVDDGAFLDGLGCYTTARISSGVASWCGRHIERLTRDALALHLGAVDPAQVARAFGELGEAAFSHGEGIIRLQASRSGGRLQLVGVPRWLGPEPDSWRAATSPLAHPGPAAWGNVKLSGNPALAVIRRWTAQQDVEEALIYDADGYLIEGTRSNLFVVTRDGTLGVPDLDRGGVRGIARDVVMEALPDARVRNLSAREIGDCRELIALNAVRGARPVIELDGKPVADGRPGPWAARLDAILAKG